MFHCLVIKVVSLLFSKQLVHIITCSSVCQQLFELLLIEKFKTEKEGFEPSRRY